MTLSTNNKTAVNVISVLLIIMIGVLYLSVKRRLTGNLFVFNTYGYITVALLFIMLLSLLLERNGFHMTSNKLLMSFLVGIICIFTIKSTSSKLLKHILWLLFVLCIGIMIYPIYKKSSHDGVLLSTIASVFFLLVVLSIYVFYSKRSTFASLGGYLMFGLLALIIFQLMDLLFFKSSNTRIKLYGFISVLLFSGFILYDTDVLLVRSKLITNPDYPSESMNIFLDIINLFSGMAGSQ